MNMQVEWMLAVMSEVKGDLNRENKGFLRCHASIAGLAAICSPPPPAAQALPLSLNLPYQP